MTMKEKRVMNATKNQEDENRGVVDMRDNGDFRQVQRWRRAADDRGCEDVE